MKRMIYFIAAMALASPVTITVAPTVQAAAVHAPKFVQMAGMAGMFEVESSRIALQKSQSQQVKDFAQQMITDHTKTSTELKGLVGEKKVEATLPTALDSSHQSKLDKLKAANERDFSSEFDSMQVSAHKDAVDLFERYAKGGDNADLKDWAGKTLPALKHHLQMAQDLDKTKPAPTIGERK
jgi:putative membrane protein